MLEANMKVTTYYLVEESLSLPDSVSCGIPRPSDKNVPEEERQTVRKSHQMEHTELGMQLSARRLPDMSKCLVRSLVTHKPD